MGMEKALNRTHEEAAEQAVEGGVREDGDRIGEDGLLVCGKCGTPKQRRIEVPFRDGPMVVRCLCACEEREAREREEREAREQAQAWATAKREECFDTAPALVSCTFESDDRKNPWVSAACERYADTFTTGDPSGLLLYGDVGGGKTYMAAAIANRLIDRGFSPLQTDVGSVAILMESSFEMRQRNLERILGHDLLVIDDIGAQRSTEYMMQHVYTLIDGCYRHGRPMVVTTNLDSERMAQLHASGPWNRILDRILEVCYPIKFVGNRRKANALEMRKSMRERLGL